MCFSLAAVSLCGAQGAQRYKAAENSALGVGQVVVKRDRDTPGQIRGFLQRRQTVCTVWVLQSVE